MDQSRMLMLNTDNVLYMNIEKRTCSIYAALKLEGEGPKKISLGTYSSIDECKKIMNYILEHSGEKGFYEVMPLGCEVDKWLRI